MDDRGPSARHRPWPRSYLYVPAISADKLAKVHSRGADAVIVDLEDAVPIGRKVEARAAAAAWLASARELGAQRPEIWVRVNSGAEGLADISAVSCPMLTGVCVPKVSAPGDLAPVQARLFDLHRTAGTTKMSPLPPLIMPVIETARGLLSVADIACVEGVARLQLGEVDLGAELGAESTAAGTGFLLARSLVILASAAAGIGPPVGPVAVGFDDLVDFRASTLLLRGLGYRSRACVHPAQVTVVNDVFSPTEPEVQRARELVRAFDEAAAAGTGVSRGPGGTMVDEAVVRAARRLLNEQGPTLAGGTDR